MIKKVALTLGLGVFLMASTGYAAVLADDKCKDLKLKATGKNSLDLFKGFGKNAKVVNTGKLATDLSKAQSKMTKGFTKAEFNGKGDPKGCDTVGDVGAIEAKVEAFVNDVIGEICPSPSGAFIDGMYSSLY